MSFLSKQWEGVWSLLPSLDFDEGSNPDHYYHHNHVVDSENLLRHKRFVNNVLAKYLEYRQKDEKKDVLDKLKIRMVRYLRRDATLINKWLDFSFERSVKELDISLIISKWHWNIWDGGLCFYYCISRRTFLNAKSLTALHLECVRIKIFYHRAAPGTTIYTSLLPSLKTMCLKSVYLENYAITFLIRECPSIESLSLASCSFQCSLFFVSSTSLKSLELNHCTAKNVIVHEAVNLESFTFVSAHFPLDLIVLNQSDNLKYINIHAQHLQTITLFGCHESVKATIDTPNLLCLQFNGYVSYSKVCVKAPNLRGASIALWDVWDEELCTIDGPWKHFPALRDFLKEFGFLESLLLSVPDFKMVQALIFPENFRKTFSSPLPNLRIFSILLSNPPTEATDMYDLRESFGWIAPSANARDALNFSFERYVKELDMALELEICIRIIGTTG
ncbi:PREDICTED: putative [Prunus dulcis]|uniref:PREDICTED: putative n=1 Tax=Prunus dulcis TaxID=3755 RepID=A0A5E4EBL2_PRUDU|nr:PREDICTED: putative [Prunus dulcis]